MASKTSGLILNQKEYLKKYLSLGGGDKKKKKKNKHSTGTSRVKIVDDDIDLKDLGASADDFDPFECAEDAPQVAGIIDERPVELQKMEEFKRIGKWKVLGNEAEESKIHGIGLIDESSIKKEKVDSDSDNAPPRAQRYYSDSDPSPPRNKVSTQRKRHNSEDDRSPARKRRTEANQTSSRRSKHDDDSDLSPSRNGHNRKQSPSHHTRRDSNSGMSPPRKGRPRHDSDESLPRRGPSTQKSREASKKSPSNKQNHDRVNDVSPPKERRRGYDSDFSPPRRGGRADPKQSPHNRESGRDMSPSRKRDHSKAVARQLTSRRNLPLHRHNKQSSSSDRHDQSPSRRRTSASGQSKSGERGCRDASGRTFSPRRQSPAYQNRSHRSRSPSERLKYDQSFRGRDKYNSKLSSPPRRKQDSSSSPRRRARQDSDSDQSQISRRQIQNSSSTRNHIDSIKRKKDEDRLGHERNKVQKSHSEESQESEKGSRPAKTLEGKKAGLQDARALKEELTALKSRENEAFSQINDELSGRGATAVLRDRATGRKRDLVKEAEKQREKELVEAERKAKYDHWGKGIKQTDEQRNRLESDMHEMSKPLARYADDEDLDKYLREQEREGDPMLEYIKQKKVEREGPKAAKPKYQGPPPPPNRFAIQPGYRWDGVDRSSGYEKQWFETQNKKKAVQEEAYKWSVSDM